MKTFLSNRASRFDFYISIKKVLLAQEKRYQVLSESIVYSYFLFFAAFYSYQHALNLPVSLNILYFLIWMDFLPAYLATWASF